MRGFHYDKSRNQALLLVALFSLSVYLFFVHQRVREARLTVPPLTTGPEAQYAFKSAFREHADQHVENYLEGALVELRKRIAAENGGGYDPRKWPLKIWQHAPSGRVPGQYAPAVASWLEQNPGWNQTVIDDAAAAHFVRTVYGGVPEIVAAYEHPATRQVQRDLLRYLVLYVHGGLWAELDVFCRRPIYDWLAPPTNRRNKNAKNLWDTTANVVVGVDRDMPYASAETMRAWAWSRPYAFADHTILAKPFARPVRLAIARIVGHAAQIAGSAQPRFAGLFVDRDRPEISGEGAWTDTLIDTMSYHRSDLTWEAFADLVAPAVMPAADETAVVVLPVTYFANGQPHSAAGPFDAPQAAVSRTLRSRAWFF
ncbi:uncharacterized protein V1510DRAFT_401548 [Dipodascopsis tothii]|uniref:uncharacterized protein n=1 Tax=Dipodascopsis tothii TaxID=44089 RepID=UPI0034CE1619